MAEKMQLEYEVSVTGLGEAAITAENAGKSADQASFALTGARSSASRTLPIMLMSVRSINAARLAVEQTTKAIEDMDPRAAMYGFLNMMQVVRNLSSIMIMLKESTGAASAAQAILATLTGRWWLIPLALAAGAIIYARIKSMQEGGLVRETGPYLLHKGEKVIPTHKVELIREKEVVRKPSTDVLHEPELIKTPEIEYVPSPEIIRVPEVRFLPRPEIVRVPEVKVVPRTEIFSTVKETEIIRAPEVTNIYRTRTERIATRTIQSFGPIFVTFEKQPREGLDMDRWLRELGPRISQQARR